MSVLVRNIGVRGGAGPLLVHWHFAFRCDWPGLGQPVVVKYQDW